MPILVVAVPMVVAQARWSLDPHAAWLGVAMAVAFAALAPVSYRVLFPDGLDFSHGAVRVVLYGLVGSGLNLSLSFGVPRLLGMQYTFLTDRTSLMVTTALFLVGGWGLGRDIGFEKRVERLTQRAERAQLLALKSHLDPHFLFNTLNAIAEWCRIDGEVAERAVLALSAMLRSMLDGVHVPLWPLEKELELAHRLFELHLLRDKSAFTLEEVLPSPLPAVQVPPMCLVTLVENAVKYGPAQGHHGVMKVEIVEQNQAIEISIENPGPFRGRRVEGVGLSTLEQHLKLAFGSRAHFTIGSAGANRTRATLSVPLHAESS